MRVLNRGRWTALVATVALASCARGQVQRTDIRAAERAAKTASALVVSSSREDWGKAASLYLDAAEQCGGKKDRKAMYLALAGDQFGRLEQKDDTLKAYRASLNLYRELKRAEDIALALSRLARAESGFREFEPAAEYYQESARIWLTTNKPDNATVMLCDAAAALSDADRIPPAVELCTQAIEVARRSGQTLVEARAELIRSGLYLKSNDRAMFVTAARESARLYDKAEDYATAAAAYESVGSRSVSGSDENIEYLRLAADEAKKGPNRILEAEALRKLGVAHRTAKRFDVALLSFRAALELAVDARDLREQGVIQQWIAVVEEARGRTVESRQAYHLAITNHREAGNKELLAQVYRGLALLERRTGDIAAAVDAYQSSTESYRSAGRLENALLVLCEEAAALSDKAQFPRAIELCGQAADEAHRAGFTQVEAKAKLTLGEVYLKTRDTPHYATATREAARLYSQAGDYASAAYTYQSVADNSAASAVECHKLAVAEAKKGSDRISEAEAYRRLGVALRTAGRFDDALAAYEAGLRLAVDAKNIGEQGILRQWIGGLYDANGKAAEARKFYLLAIADHQSAGSNALLAQTFENLALLSTTSDDVRSFYLKCAAAYRSSGDPSGEARATLALADRLLRFEAKDEALRTYRAAVELGKDAKDGERLAEALSRLAKAESHFKMADTAVAHFGESAQAWRTASKPNSAIIQLCLAATTLSEAGRTQQTLELTTQAAAEARRLGAVQFEAKARVTSDEVYLKAKDIPHFLGKRKTATTFRRCAEGGIKWAATYLLDLDGTRNLLWTASDQGNRRSRASGSFQLMLGRCSKR